MMVSRMQLTQSLRWNLNYDTRILGNALQLEMLLKGGMYIAQLVGVLPRSRHHISSEKYDSQFLEKLIMKSCQSGSVNNLHPI